MDYSKLVELYEKLDSTTKRLVKTKEISKFLKEVPEQDLGIIVLLVQGRIFPAWDERNIGVASRLVMKAVSKATGVETKKVEDEWRNLGDLGEVAKKLVAKKKQATLFSSKLTVKKVFENIENIAKIEGKGSVDRKLGLITELLTSAEPLEAKYIVRLVLEELRLGVGDGSLRDAIVWAFFGEKLGLGYDEKKNEIILDDREEYTKYVDSVQAAYDISNDLGKVASTAKKKGIEGFKEISINIGKPLKVMLFPKSKDIEDAFSRVGKPAAFEYKYDGFRMQVHKKGNDVKIFTRRLENVTKQFPEVAELAKKNIDADSCVIDCEAVGYDKQTGTYKPFQEISQRIRRKYDIEKMAEELPVELNVFDIISYEGKNMITEPFIERRKILEKIIKQSPKNIVLAKQIITSEEKEAEKFYEESLKMGNEGLMAKKLDAVYKPGSRVGYGVKIKPTMEELDLVIVGAEWGTGKRSGWLSSFSLACIDDDGNFLEIGKVGTGIKEKEDLGVSFEQMTELLKPLIKSEKGREVKIKPQIVVEIRYEEIQKSTNYESGYALRFPRLVKIREDRRPEEINTINDVEDLYYAQKKR